VAHETDATARGFGAGQDERVGSSATLTGGARVGKYGILAVLGQGGFGVTYRAHDMQLDREVAIKEYLPIAFAVREHDGTVLPRSTQTADDFRWGRSRFLDEARTLARLEHAPGVVNVYDFMEANGTAYMVMALVPGETLEARLRRERVLPQPAIGQLLGLLLKGLERVHAAGFLHRDIKPANILIDRDGQPTLIDFGASRAALQGRTQTLTAVYTPGYAAFEQFSSAKQGPWTDIYALGATLYHCVTGGQPPSAIDRMQDDTMVPAMQAAHGRYAANLLAGIDAALRLKAADRPQSIAEWWRLLAGAAPAGGGGASSAGAAMVRSDAAPGGRIVARPPRGRRMLLYGAAAAILMLGLLGGYVWWRGVQEDQAWARATAAGTDAAYRDYLADYPSGRYAAEARKALADAQARAALRAEDEAWSRAKAANAIPALRAYLERYPSGRYVTEARILIANVERAERAEDEAWAAAKAANTESSVQAYLDKYPSGRYVSEARELKAAIAREPRSRDCSQCPEMVRLRPGSFTMGSPSGEPGREYIEGPQHRVAIGYAFSLGRYEVTRAEFAEFVAATGHRAAGDWRNPGFSQTDRDPVVNVSWNDAKAYVAWLSQMTGKSYRLPTESEWEYAARAGTETVRFWGNDDKDGCAYANAQFRCPNPYANTAPVGRFKPNQFGLHDMLGNVWEWTEDCWADREGYAGSPTDGSASSSGDCARRVLRGGSWGSQPRNVRSASRNGGSAGGGFTHYGFRVARTDSPR
jgi:formylglycine-generating enzyme required for sulfatase activity